MKTRTYSCDRGRRHCWHCAAAQLVHEAGEGVFRLFKGAGALPGSLGIATGASSLGECNSPSSRGPRAARELETLPA